MTKLAIPAEFELNNQTLANQVVLVTGATGAIGSEICLGLGKAGASVILAGRNIDKLEKLYDQLLAEGCPEPAIFPVNFEGAGPHDFDEMAEKIQEAFGTLNGVVHCAAKLGQISPCEISDPYEWMQVFQVNLHSAYLMTRACLPMLKKSENASVLYMADETGRQGKAYWGAYSVSKAGLENLMQVLHQEYEQLPNIRFNTLEPGAVASELRSEAFPAEDADALPGCEQIVNSVAFLISEHGKSTSGGAFSL